MIAPLVRNIIAAGTAAFAVAFSQMDANPSLFVYEKFLADDQRRSMCFQGKTVWITGASSGIGAELAKQLSQYGVNIILSARPSDRLESVADECRRQAMLNCDEDNAATVSIVPLDLSSSPDELAASIDTILQTLDGRSLDYVIFNAGKGQQHPASSTNHQITQDLFQVNTLAPIALTQILLERGALRQDRGRHLVVTSSVGAKFGLPLSASYAASKHALHGYYNSLVAENPWLRVDLVCPGTIDTEFHQNYVGGSFKKPDTAPSSQGVLEASPDCAKRQMKMSVQRCTRLMVASMMMHSRREYWIAEHPVLLGMYINQYFPHLFNFSLSKVGPIRVKAWEDGKDLYDPSTWKR